MLKYDSNFLHSNSMLLFVASYTRSSAATRSSALTLRFVASYTLRFVVF